MPAPTFDNEGGGDKVLQLTDSQATPDSAFLTAIEIATIASITVGWLGVATHIEGDAIGSPGGFSPTGNPLVLVGGDDGANVVPLQLASGGDLKITLDSEAVVLGAGTAVFGRLAANSGIDIGDVDVTSLPALATGSNTIGNIGTIATSITPGTAAANLGKAIDSAAAGTDTGVMALAIRDDTLTTLTPVDGDYVPLRVSSTGQLHVTGGGGGTQFNVDDALGGTATGTLALVRRDDVLSALTPAEGDAVELRVDANGALWTHDDALDAAISGSELQVDIVASLPAGTNNIGDVDVLSLIPGTSAPNLGKAIDSSAGGTDTGVAALAIRDDALTTLTPVDGDYVPLRVSSTGALHVTGGGGGTQFNVDSALGATPEGTLAIARRDDVLSALSPVEGDAIELRVDANGALWTHDDSLDDALDAGSRQLRVDIIAVLPIGTNSIGDIANIGTSITPGTAAANLGKAEDAAHTTGDVGVMALAVRGDAETVLAADGDYIPLLVNSVGRLKVDIVETQGAITVSGTITAGNTAGDIAHDGIDSGNPVKLGGRGQESTAQPDEVADNDRVDALFDRNGYLRVRGDFNPQSAVINDSVSGDNTIVAAAGAGKRIAIWAILIVSDGTTDVRWEDGAGGTALTGQTPLQAREGYAISAGGLVPLFIGSANTLMNLELTAAVNVHGFVSYTVIDD